jgi:hypothetical protein
VAEVVFAKVIVFIKVVGFITSNFLFGGAVIMVTAI